MSPTIAEAKAAFAATAKTALEVPAAPEDPKHLNIGVIGCGRIGQLHAANIVHRIPNASLVCVSDVFESAAIKCAQKHSVPMACKEAADLIANPAVQAVIVCSPTDTHADIIRAAAAAGKHVFCEKPVDKSLEVIGELEKVVEDTGVKFFLGFQRRFDKHFLKAKEMRESGKLGKVVKLNLVSRDPSPPPIGYLKQSGGIFLDMSSHDFDMARYLTGSDIVEISAVGVANDAEIGEIGDLDQTILTLKFANGCIGTIDNGRRSPVGYDQRADLMGSEGSVQVENVVPSTCKAADAKGYSTDAPLNFFMERYADAYVKEMEAFVDAVVNDKEVPCGIQDGRLTIVYGACAKLSMKEKRPVLVSEIDKPLADITGVKEATARY